MKFTRLRNVIGRPFNNDFPSDPQLYNKVKMEAERKFGNSLKQDAKMWIKERYRKLGGLFKYHGKK